MADEFDALVIGAGPAGIVSALELADAGLRVALVESGQQQPDAQIQSLGDAAHFDPHRHAPMELCTRRQVGGASNIWGGRCVPYDEVDFQKRDFVTEHPWPVGYGDIQPYFQRASDYFFIGDAIFTTEPTSDSPAGITPLFHEGEFSSTRLERWSLPTNFRLEYQSRLEQHSRIELLTGWTCVGFSCGNESRRVDSVTLCNSKRGNKRLVSAKVILLGMGGLETTRLLMATQESENGYKDGSGTLGRYYMGHISGRIAKIRLNGSWKDTNYAFLRDKDGVYLRQRITMDEEEQVSHQINNIAAWLVNPSIGDASHRNGVLSFAYLILSSPIGRFLAPEAIRKSAVSGASGTKFEHIWNMISQPFKTLSFIPSFGIRRFLLRRKIPGFFQPAKSNTYDLHYHGEQIPNKDSGVTLAEAKDSLGLPKLDIDFQFAEQDVESVLKFHERLDVFLRTNSIGELEYCFEDLRAAVWDQAHDGYHQAGTTRMSDDPSTGVVDGMQRVHGTDNLYVVSSSNFVTSGQANSTFMIVAFALRTCDHIRKVLNE